MSLVPKNNSKQIVLPNGSIKNVGLGMKIPKNVADGALLALDLMSNPAVQSVVKSVGQQVYAGGQSLYSGLFSPSVSSSSSSMVAAPAAASQLVRMGAPRLRSVKGGDGRINVKHSELLRPVPGSVAFQVTALSINPGLAQTFWWLSQIASNYESYKFNSLSFRFVSQKSSATSGLFMMACDYEASDSNPVNQQELMNFHGSVASPPWSQVVLRCDRRDLLKFGTQRYVRSGALASNLDVKTYDVADLLIGVQGMADTTTVGSIYVDYDVDLITPQSNLLGSISSNCCKFYTTSASRAAPFTGTQTISGGLDVSATAATMTFGRVGQYLLTSEFVGTVVTNVAPTLTGTATTSLIVQQTANAAATAGTFVFVVTVNNINETVIFDYTASCATLTANVQRLTPYLASLA